jgi:DNA replication and repair protein RecF
MVVGPNGHGKTNLIEAVYFLCLGRSFREHRHSRLIRFEAPAARVAAELNWMGRTRGLEIKLPRSGPKQAELDGAPLDRLSEIIGVVPVVSLTPEDGELAHGAPGSRRRYLDVVLAQTNRAYLEALKYYRRARAQRNAGLRAGRIDVAESYEEALTESGSTIQKERAHLIDYVASEAAEIYQRVSGSGEDFTVTYRPSPAGDPDADPAERLAEELAGRREMDLERGFTGVGPHRDEIHLEVDGRALQLYGSHGQARTAVVALKLAELEYYADAYDRQPVLLMDEVASVLDRLRARELIELLMQHSSQILVTSPEEKDLGPMAEAIHDVITVEEGKASAG